MNETGIDELLKEKRANCERNAQINEMLSVYQAEALKRLYGALKDAYACGIRFYDADRCFIRRKLYPLDVDYCKTDNNGNLILELTHRPDDDVFFNYEDFPY